MDPYRSFGLLEGVDAKIRRAREHLDLLKARIEALYADPQSGWFDYSNNGEAALMVHFRANADLCAIAGDAVQNIRAALDHLVWDLVLLAGEEPGTHTSFPIYQRRNDFRQRALRGNKNRPAQLLGLNPRGEAVRRIVWVQPYRGPDPPNHWLALLSRFANHDKHHTLYSVGSMPTDLSALRRIIHWNTEARFLWGQIRQVEWIEGKTELARFAFDPAGPSPDMYVDGKFAVTPAFSDPHKVVSYSVLDHWQKWLAEYVDQFRGLFD